MAMTPWLFLALAVSVGIGSAPLGSGGRTIGTANAQEADDALPPDSAVRRTGLPIPRFVSLGSDEANIRTGPGRRYPIDWVFLRRGMPLEVTAEYDTWRRIRDWEGTSGWIHQSLLSGRRTIIVVGTERTLRANPDPHAAVVARVEPGVVGPVLTCEDAWCEVAFEDYHGWLQRDAVWGVYEDEEFD